MPRETLERGPDVGRSAVDPVVDGRRSRWTEHRTGRRADFVAAGATAVDRYGADVSAEQVAEVANVSRTVLYRYFRDRDDLRLAVDAYIVDDLVDTIERHVRVRPRTLRQANEGTIGAILEWFDTYPNRHYFIRNQRGSTAAEQGGSSFAGRVAEILQSSMGMIGVEAGVAVPIAHGIVGLVEYMAGWWLEERSMTREELAAVTSGAVWLLIDGTLRGSGLELGYDDPLPRVEAVPAREPD